MHTIETFTLDNGYRVELGYDDSPENPIEESTWFVMCNLYDKRSYSGHRDWKVRLREDMRAVGKDISKENYASWFEEGAKKHGWVVLPVYKFDHSAVAYRTSSFNDRWDSGLVGYIYTTPERLRREGISFDLKSAEKYLRANVETYSQWANGEVYLASLIRKDGLHIESSGGFYSITDAKEFAKDAWGELLPWLSPVERIEAELEHAESALVPSTEYGRGLKFALACLKEK